MKPRYLYVILAVIFSLHSAECELFGIGEAVKQAGKVVKQAIDKEISNDEIGKTLEKILNQVDGKETIREGVNAILETAENILADPLDDPKVRADDILKEVNKILIELEKHGKGKTLRKRARNIQDAAMIIFHELAEINKKQPIRQKARVIKVNAEKILEELDITLRKRVDGIRDLLGKPAGKKTVFGFLHELEKTGEGVKEDVGLVNTNVESIGNNIGRISNELDGSINLIMGTEDKVDDIGTTIDATRAAVDQIEEKVHRMERALAENAKLQEENAQLQEENARLLRHLFRVFVGASPSKFLRRHRRKRV